MMVLVTILTPVLFIVGIFCRDGNLEPTPRWQAIGNFLMALSYLLFIVLLVVAAISGAMVQ